MKNVSYFEQFNFLTFFSSLQTLLHTYIVECLYSIQKAEVDEVIFSVNILPIKVIFIY